MPLLLLASLVTAALGAVGGLGGAVLLVPVLVLFGVPPAQAAPLGLLSVAGGSIASGPQQLRERSVNHRIGITTEVAASAGAVAGAVLSNVVPDAALIVFLAAVALAAAVASGRRSAAVHHADPSLGPKEVGERVGSLAGAYPLGDGVVLYRPRRLPATLALMGLSGLVAGSAGASGGFIKTPTTSEILNVPIKVAASTTTFTIGITSAAALVVFALQGRIDPHASAAVVLGSLAGGRLGVAFQSRLSPRAIRQVLRVVLIGVAVVLLAQA